MIVTYSVDCFERELKVVFPDGYDRYRTEIEQMLDEDYDEWCNPEDIEDEEERACVECSCCEEHMMFRLSVVFNQWTEWTSVYYGDDESEMEDEIEWTKNPQKEDV